MSENKFTEKINEWNSVYGHSKDDILFIKKLRQKGFDEEQIYKILKILEDTCDQCWNSELGCNCWKDE